MTKQSDMSRLIQEEMANETASSYYGVVPSIDIRSDLAKITLPTSEPTPTPVSPYHNIRLALSGKTAPFINMPLGTTRVYVERIG